jgi:hypothetical protein
MKAPEVLLLTVALTVSVIIVWPLVAALAASFQGTACSFLA